VFNAFGEAGANVHTLVEKLVEKHVDRDLQKVRSSIRVFSINIGNTLFIAIG